MSNPMAHRAPRFAALALALAVAACGGKNKGTTKPGDGTGGGSDATGMTDKGPDGTGTTTGGGGAGGGGSGGPTDTWSAGGDGTGGDGTGGTGGDGTGGAGDGTGGDGGSAEAPKVVPPNLDPDPNEARAAVQSHLKTARDALAQAKPDPDLAIREAREALTVDGTSVDAVVVLAHAYYTKKLYDTAETILDMLYKDREVSHKHPGVFYVYGLIYDKTNQDAKAFAAYKQAVQLKGDYAPALMNLGVHQLQNKQYDEAIATYEKLTGSLGQTDAPTWNNLGSAYRGKSADYDAGSSQQAAWLAKAENALKRATSADKNYGPAYYNLGLLYLDADPFPNPDGSDLDTLVRLQKAKAYFEEYKNLPGVDMKLFDERTKNVDKLIKREEKKRKAKANG
ncbi:MAG: hypothetical protein H6709_19890 [Kofleriaceae bacterium]|nr:hypothetical protein [Kofleriaceae bacterium]